MSNNTRPNYVVCSVWLYIASLMLGLLKAIIVPVPGEKLPGLVFVILMLAFPLAFWCRQNWARLLFLVFFLLGLPALFLIRDQLMQRGALAVTTLAAQTILQGVSVAFLFTRPADAWFRRQSA